MKLYTESEIISAYEKAELCHLRMESFIELMTPIKLPSDEEIKNQLIELVQSLKDYTQESKTILGHDERDASEFVEIFLNQHTHENNNRI